MFIRFAIDLRLIPSRSLSAFRQCKPLMGRFRLWLLFIVKPFETTNVCPVSDTLVLLRVVFACSFPDRLHDKTQYASRLLFKKIVADCLALTKRVQVVEHCPRTTQAEEGVLVDKVVTRHGIGLQFQSGIACLIERLQASF